MEGLQIPSAGNISIFGKAPTQLCPQERGRIGIVFQRYALPSHLSVTQLCELYQSMYPEEDDRESLMEQLGLSHLLRQQIGDLSAGQRQRLSIFAALYGKKSLVILDEPTSALDVRSRRAVWDALLTRKRSGQFSGIIATHHMEEAMELCDRIYFIDNGEIKVHGNSQDLLECHSHQIYIKFTATQEFLQGLNQLLPAEVLLKQDGQQVALACASHQAAGLIGHILRLEQENNLRINLTVSQPSLEDVYLSVISN